MALQHPNTRQAGMQQRGGLPCGAVHMTCRRASIMVLLGVLILAACQSTIPGAGQSPAQSEIPTTAQSPTPNQSPAASQSPTATQPAITIAIPDTLTSFPIQSPDLSHPRFSCPANVTSAAWYLSQWTNEFDLCAGTSTPDVTCPSPDFFRATPGSRVCYWSSTKTTQLTLNTGAFKDNGCEEDQEPYYDPGASGGYAMFLTYDATNRADFAHGFPSLAQLNQVRVKAGVQVNMSQLGTCPPGLPMNKVPGNFDPTNTNFISIMGEDENPAHSAHDQLFYQVIVYDSRYMGVTGSGNIYSSCDAAHHIGIYNDLVKLTYGVPYALPGATAQDYDIDLLPQFKAYLTRCFGSTPGFSLSDYKFLLLYMGSENTNNTNTEVTFTNPSLALVTKS